MTIETKALVMTPAMKPGIVLHDALIYACTPIADWEDREDHLGTCPFHLDSQGSEFLLDLAQVLLYHVIGAHMEENCLYFLPFVAVFL